MPLPLAIPIATTLIGMAGQAYGNVKSGQEMNKAQGLLQGQQDELTSWFDTESNKDFLESNVARAAINKVLENIQEQNKQIESSATVTGASDASKIAMKGQNQQQFADVVQNLASYGTRRQDDITNRYRSELSRILGLQTNMAMGQANNYSNIASNAAGLIGASGDLFGLTKWGETTKTPETPETN